MERSQLIANSASGVKPHLSFAGSGSNGEIAAPTPRMHGFQRTLEGGRWNLWAPRAAQVDLILIEHDACRIQAMERLPFGWFTASAADVPDGRRYFFRLDRQREAPDPASAWQPDGVHESSAVFLPDEFQWTDEEWRGVALADLALYELHVGTFTEAGTFDAVIPHLAELVDLGITCLELMPLAQFPGRRGWGYDGTYPFAAQASYGGPRGLQRLVDACHAHGLAVMLDVVYNHLGPEGNYSALFGPYFHNRYQTPWGSAWNYDDTGSDDVRRYVLDNVRWWLREFHFDGLRLDAVHAIYDRSPTHILREIQLVAEEESRRCGRPLHIIAESDLNDVRLLQPPEAGGYGLAAQWSDDFHHAVHTMITGERDGYYTDYGSPAHLVKAFNQTFVYDGATSLYRGRRHGGPVGALSGERFVVSVQNHDQVGNRALGDRFGSLISFAQQRAAAALLLTAPYLPLLFMGEEYGESRPFPFFCDFGDAELREAVRQGRRQEFLAFGWPDLIPDPQEESTFASAVIRRDFSPDSPGGGLRRWYQDLLKLRRGHPAMRDFEHRKAIWHSRPLSRESDSAADAAIDTGGLLELRRGGPGGHARRIFVQFNLSDRPQPALDRRAKFEHDALSLLLSSESGRYGGERSDDHSLAELLPWEVQIFTTDPASSS